MLKKSFLCVLAFCLLLCAAACAEHISITFPGTGTEADPYQIATKEDLIQLATFVNQEYSSEDYDALHAYYQLTADIALNDCSDFVNWDVNPPELNWTPIGYGANSFDGIFDGNGHTISGLYTHQDVEQFSHGPNSSFGLFGNVSNKGCIKNLNVANAHVHPKYVQGLGGTNTGIIAGESSGKISGCSVDGVLICEGGVYGGVVGGNYGEIVDCNFVGRMIERTVYVNNAMGGIAGSAGAISDCISSAEFICEKNSDELLTYADMGGIAGMMSGADAIQNCIFTGTIRCEGDAGGIAGSASASNLPSDEDNKGLIINCVNEGSVTAAGDVGGIVGVCMDKRTTELWVDSCVNRGEVKSLSEDTCSVGGIVGCIDTRHGGNIIVVNCCNEIELCGNMVGGIVGRANQNTGSIRVVQCTNKGLLRSEGSYAGGILCHLMQWGDEWSMTIDQCINEGDIVTDRNAGGILCFAYDVDPDGKNRSMVISDCVNRGNLTSNGSNNFLGGILGADAMSKTMVSITGCSSEGNLEFAKEILVDAETLSGSLFTLSRISGGIVGYVGTTPFLCVDSGERKLGNINTEDAYLNIANCSSTGSLLSKEAKFADDVNDALLEAWKKSGVDDPLEFFIALKGGIVGTIADDKNYNVNIIDCTFENSEKAIDDWNL